MRSRLLWFLCLLFFAPAMAAVKHSQTKELQALAKAYGFPAAVTDAAATWIDTGDSSPLRQLLRREDVMVVIGAAGLLFEIGEPFAPEGVARLRRGEGSPDAQIACLVFATDRATVEYLIERLGSEKDARLQTTITMTLRVITGKDFASGDGWRAWWRNQLRKYRPKSRSTEEVLSKLAMAQSANVRDLLQKMAKEMKGGKGPDAMDKVAGILGTLAALQEEGRQLKLSPAASEGDACFARGDLAGAASAYERATMSKRRGDHRSAFMLGCAYLELGKMEEAQQVFARLFREDSRRKAAGFMADLCGKEKAEPGKLLDHATALLNAMGEPDDLMTWGDPVLRMIVSQKCAMVPGPEYVDVEIVAERFASEEDPLALLGLALCHPPPMQSQLLKMLSERFPQHPVIVSQSLSRHHGWTNRERRVAYLPKIRAWIGADPDNALPRLLEIAVSIDSSMKPVEQAPHPAPELLSQLEEALRLPRYEPGAEAAARAFLKALRSVGAPSAARLGGASSQGGISHLLSYLSLAANGAMIRHEAELLDRISDIHAAISQRAASVARSSLDQLSASVQRKASRSLQVKHMRLHRADDPRLQELEVEEKEITENAKKVYGQRAALVLEILPVPCLQRAILEKVYRVFEE